MLRSPIPRQRSGPMADQVRGKKAEGVEGLESEKAVGGGGAERGSVVNEVEDRQVDRNEDRLGWRGVGRVAWCSRDEGDDGVPCDLLLLLMMLFVVVDSHICSSSTSSP